MTTGLLLVLIAGLFQGSFLLPSKWLRDWKWENYWLLFSISAYLICPWLLAIATVPNLWRLYQNLESSIAIPVVLFGLGWGLGAVTFGLGIEALGLALGFAVIVGVATIAGTLLPMWLLPTDKLSTTQIGLTAVSLFLTEIPSARTAASRTRGLALASWPVSALITGGSATHRHGDADGFQYLRTRSSRLQAIVNVVGQAALTPDGDRNPQGDQLLRLHGQRAIRHGLLM